MSAAANPTTADADLPCRALTIKAAAAELDVTPETVVRWIEAGHLAAFVAPSRSIGDAQAGPKGLRILRDDWERFIRARTMTGGASAPVALTTPITHRPAPAPATGTDGISRRRRGRAG